MPSALVIRPAEATDAPVWQRMRESLRSGDHAQDIARYFAGPRTPPREVLLACLGSGAAIGFVELSIREAEGAAERETVVDACYVEPGHRGQGVDAALMTAAAEWSRANYSTLATLAPSASSRSTS